MKKVVTRIVLLLVIAGIAVIFWRDAAATRALARCNYACAERFSCSVDFSNQDLCTDLIDEEIMRRKFNQCLKACPEPFDEEGRW